MASLNDEFRLTDEAIGADTSEFALGDITKKSVDSFTAYSRGLLASFAVDPSEAPNIVDGVANEFVMNGESNIWDTILKMDTEDRKNLEFSSLQSALNNEVLDLGPLRDTADANSRRMRASEILDRMGVIQDQGVRTRSMLEVAAENQRKQFKPSSLEEEKAVGIFARAANGTSLSGSQFMGIQEQFSQTGVIGSPEDRQRVMSILSPITDKERGNSGFLTTAGQWANTAASYAIPGPYYYRRNEIFSRLFPDIEYSAANPVSIGIAIQEGRARISQMNAEELKVFTAQAKQILEEETGFMNPHFGSVDDIMITDFWMTFFDDVDNQGMLDEGLKGILDTSIGVLDMLPYGSFVGRRLQNLFQVGRAAHLIRQNRPIARELTVKLKQLREARGNVGTPLDEEKALQARLEDLIRDGYVKGAGSGSRGMASILDDWDLRVSPLQAADRSLANLSPLERSVMEATSEGRSANSIEELGYNLQIQNSEVGVLPGGLTVDHAIGATVDTPFASPSYTAMIVDALDDGSDRLIRVEAHNPLTGRTRTVTREELGAMEDNLNSLNTYQRAGQEEVFTIRVTDRVMVSPEHVLAGEMDASRIGITGKLAGWVSKSSLYQRWFVNSSNIAEATTDATIQALRSVRNDYTNLGYLSRERADRAINHMDQQGVDMDLRAIVDMVDGDIAAARGVLSVRRWADAIHFNTNASALKELRGWNGRAAYFSQPIGGRDAFIARRATTAENPGEVIFNPVTNKAAQLSQEEFEALIREGYQLFELRHQHRAGKQYFKYFWKDPDNKAVKIGKLPANVVPKLKGYMPRIYDANYMVARVVKGTDRFGKEYVGREPVSMHNNLEQANRDIAIRRGLGDKEEYVPLGTRELEALDDPYLLSHTARMTVDYLESSGRLFTTARGKKLEALTEGSFDGQRAGLKDILDTMEIAEFKVGNSHMRELVSMMTERWMRDYGDTLGVENAFTKKREMPIWGDLDANKIDRNVRKELLAKATADRDHIQLVSGVDRTRMRKAWANIMTDLSEKLVTRNNPGSNRYRLGDTAVKIRLTDPFTMLRRVNFIRNIAWAPLRQLPLQAASMTLYATAPHALGYMVSGRASREMMALITYNLSKDLPGANDDFARWAKTLGMDESEYRQLGEAFESTGFMQAVDSHAYAVGNYNSAVGQFAQSSRAFSVAGQGVKNFNDFMRRVGFDVGEKTQQMFAFLIERNRYIQEGKNWKDPEVFAQLIGDTRSRTLNMSRTGSTKMNRGAAGLMFQFMQWNIRVLQAMLPRTLPFAQALSRKTNGKVGGKWYEDTIGKLGDATFTGQEKLRMAVGQTLLWGVGGWGFTQGVDTPSQVYSTITGEPINISPEVAEIVREGIIGETINWSVRTLMNDNSSLMVSSAFSPVAGTAGNIPDADRLDSNPLTRIYEGLFLQQYRSLWDLIGPTSATAPALYRSLRNAWVFMGMPLPDGTELPFNPDKSPDLAMDSILRFIPSYNNWMKGKAAMAIGRLVTEGGDLGAEATKGEAAMKAILGIQSTEERELSTLYLDLHGTIDKLRDPEYKEVQAAARNYYENMKLLARRLQIGEIDQLEFYNTSMQHSGMMNYLIDDPLEQDKFWDSFADLMRSDLNENRQMVVADALASAVDTNDIPSIPRSITMINNLQSIPEDHKKILTDNLTMHMEFLRNGRLPTDEPVPSDK